MLTTTVVSGFKIKRALNNVNGFTIGVDATVAGHLGDLNQLLAKRIFNAGGAAHGAQTVPTFLTKELTPKRVPPDPHAWAGNTVARILAGSKEDAARITLSEYIDTTPELVQLKYAFQNDLAQNWVSLDYNTRAVLEGYANISDYLISYAFEVMHLADINALSNFILKNINGARNVANYGIVSAARSLIDLEQLNVPGYNEDDGDLANALRTAGISLSATSFKTAAKAKIQDFVFNTDELELINGSSVGPIPAAIKPLLVKYIQLSPIPITADNVDFYLPVFISQAMKSQGLVDPEDSALDFEDQDFAVQFQEQGDTAVADISRSAVRCAAQLYFAMVLGDELDVFGAVNYFTHKYLIRGGLEIKDKRLRSDLRMYVFSDKFIDLATSRTTDRTRPAERQMFYRQVFNEGTAEVTEDVIVNQDFKRLWKVMVLESAKYLQRAQASFNPDNFVSRQNVMQAVEDLQYNLSINCTGMVNVIAPLIDAELNFVLSRILKHPEVIQHVVPSGGTWQRVVETLATGMKRARPRSTTLYNKARLGDSIIRSIAEYTSSAFEDDGTFSDFISQVDAFITTQSILQESMAVDIHEDDEAEAAGTRDDGAYPEEQDAQPAMPRAKAGAAAAAGSGGGGAGDEWDF